VPDAPYTAFLIVFAVAFGLALGLTPLTGWIGRRLKLVALPGGRRQHSQPIPRIGGVPMYLAFVGAVIVAQLLPVDRFDPKEIIRLAGLLVGGTFIFLFGLYDDWRELAALPQYIAQLIAGGIAVAFLILIEYVNNPLTGLQTPTSRT
jgi:UDP-GlcNAc:undecaprenyl-phosphate GlcNAc-1-phosphate transferase